MNLNFNRAVDWDEKELSYQILERFDYDFNYGRSGCGPFEPDHPSQNIS